MATRFPTRALPALPVAWMLCCSCAVADADPAWQRIPVHSLRTAFAGHELTDGVHYAYRFRDDGTFSGFQMGREVAGTWRITDDALCWTQKRRGSTEECYQIETRGRAVRLLRDGYEAYAATLQPLPAPSRDPQ